MKLYLDASAFVKAFVDEEGSDSVLEALDRAALSSSSRITYVECHAAFARSVRERRMSSRLQLSMSRDFGIEWPQLVVVELDEGVMRDAAEIARDYAVRASDAIHLASAAIVADGVPTETLFACWDRRLWDAAGAMGFARLPEKSP